jgi:hypothetical protein
MNGGPPQLRPDLILIDSSSRRTLRSLSPQRAYQIERFARPALFSS